MAVQIRQYDDVVGLEVIERTPEGHPCSGDAKFRVRVQVSGMETNLVGQISCWVSLESLESFAKGLQMLDQARKGASVLYSMSPGELRLEIRSTGSLGHMEVFGHIGHPGVSGTGLRKSEIAFAIPLDPTQLPTIAQDFSELLRKPYCGWLTQESV